MLASTTLELIALFGFAAILIAAAVSDVRRLIVPNRYCAAIVLLYPVHVLAAPSAVDWLGALAVAGICLAVGFVLFSLRVFGGGDAKLFTAASLWAGPALFPELLMGTAVAGGLLAVAYLVHRRLAGGFATAGQAGLAGPPDNAMRNDAPSAATNRSRWQRQLPYGVAVASGGLLIAVMIFLGR